MELIDLLTSPHAWAALVTLTVMEIVLGIDNIVFLGILVSRLPEPQSTRARRIGLALALVFRIALLSVLSWLIGLTAPIFTVLDQPVSWRDLILLGGGAFLIVKATMEIHGAVEGHHEEDGTKKVTASFGVIIAQIVVIDLVFSIDSIITAIGMVESLAVMVAAVCIAVAVMYVASAPVSAFISRHPTTKMLALAFLILIGVALVADGLGFHVPRGYIYSAMAFSALVEFLNVAARTRLQKRHKHREAAAARETTH